MTPDQPPASPRPSRKGLWVAIGLGLAALALAVWGPLQLLPESEPAAAPEPTPTATANVTAVPTGPGDAGWVAPTRRVTLPEGSAQIDELPIGFPDNPTGAVAAEVTKDRYVSLDYEFAVATLQAYAAPEFAAYSERAATDAVRQLRQKVGAPATGDVPLALAVSSRPYAVQWEVVSPTEVDVSVLAETRYRAIDKEWTEISASTTTWRWMTDPTGREDWRLVEGRPPSAALAALGTQEFNDAGWIAIGSGQAP
jgi:hypothetical protein